MTGADLGGFDTTTLSQYVEGVEKRQGHFSAMYSGPDRLGHVIILNRGTYVNHHNRPETFVTFIHELLHAVIPGGQEVVASALGIKHTPGPEPSLWDLAASAAIDDWLKGCYKGYNQ